MEDQPTLTQLISPHRFFCKCFDSTKNIKGGLKGKANKKKVGKQLILAYI